MITYSGEILDLDPARHRAIMIVPVQLTSKSLFISLPQDMRALHSLSHRLHVKENPKNCPHCTKCTTCKQNAHEPFMCLMCGRTVGSTIERIDLYRSNDDD